MQTQGKILTTAALAAGGALLLSRQMRSSTHASTPMWAAERAIAAERALEHQIRSRPGTFGTIATLVIGGLVLNQMMKSRTPGAVSSVEETIHVDVPLSTAYNQWTQFEEFPRFMAGVQEVRQIDDTHLHWRVNVAGKTEEWDAEITEQIPDQRIAWRSTGGVKNSGVVTFNRAGDNKTQIMLHMDYEPKTIGEKVGDVVGGVKLLAKGNLRRFKDLIEGRGVETGAWRGVVTH